MIAAQTLNLYKYYNADETNSIRLQLIMLMLSSYLLRKHYDRVILYTDAKTAKMLSDSYYTEIRLLPNDILIAHEYVTLPKLYTYSNVEEEFIHIDVDYFLFNKIELEDKIICSYSENREKCGESGFGSGYSWLIDKLKSNYSEFGFNVVNENYAMNMSIFGVPKVYHKDITEYFKKLNEYTEKNIKTISQTYDINYPPHWAIEQYIPAQFFLENKFKIKELNEFDNFQIKGHSGYIRIYDPQNFSNITNFRIQDIDIKKSLSEHMRKNIGYHLWYSKKMEGIDDLLMIVIAEMYPELEIKINSILEKNLLIGKKDSNNKRLI
jgi:hypothetical protein